MLHIWTVPIREKSNTRNGTQLVENSTGQCGNQKALREHLLGTCHQLEQIWARNKPPQHSHQFQYITVQTMMMVIIRIKQQQKTDKHAGKQTITRVRGSTCKRWTSLETKESSWARPSRRIISSIWNFNRNQYKPNHRKYINQILAKCKYESTILKRHGQGQASKKSLIPLHVQLYVQEAWLLDCRWTL